jgi:hypothetical protein
MKRPVPQLRALCVLVIASCAAPAYALNFNDGKWQVTVDTEIKGMKVRPPPTYYYTRCFTKDSFQPSLAPPEAPCRAVNTQTKDDVMTWTLSCASSVAQMEGSGRMVFSGNQVRGVVMTQSQYPEPMQVIQKITAKRVGACDMGGGTPLEGKAPLRPPMRDYQP